LYYTHGKNRDETDSCEGDGGGGGRVGGRITVAGKKKVNPGL